MTENRSLFPDGYEASRERFRGYLERVQAYWPAACCNSRSVGAAAEGLTIDWIEAGALRTPEKVLLFTLGEHGIEGYVGSAMLDLFVQEFLPRLDPQTTGIVLVHAVNPWGMKHRRRTNAANVDLNRNFVWDERDLNLSANPDYANANRFLNPEAPPTSRAAMTVNFGFGLLSALARPGMAKFRRAVLFGQYEFPAGIYYGGSSIQEEVRTLSNLYRSALASYSRILLLDMHTGYGPRRRMSLVNSVQEARSSAQLQSEFSYPDIVKTDPAEFYAIQGDMIDYIYTLAANEFPDRHLYATSFEFGTFGDSMGAILRSLRTMIFENRLHRFGTSDDGLRASIQDDFTEMFFPQAADWQDQAVQNARTAFAGILRAEGMYRP
jgi:predicted deacylase